MHACAAEVAPVAAWDGEVVLDWRGAEVRAKITFSAIREIERLTGAAMSQVAQNIASGATRHTYVAAVLCACFHGAGQRSPDTGRAFDIDEVGILLCDPALAPQIFSVALALVVHVLSGGPEGEELMGKLRETQGSIVLRLGKKTIAQGIGRQRS